jgi:hypothetical protein
MFTKRILLGTSFAGYDGDAPLRWPRPRSNNYQYNFQGFRKKKKKKGKIHFTLSKVNHFFTFVSKVLKVAIYPNKVSKIFNITTLLIICLL